MDRDSDVVIVDEEELSNSQKSPTKDRTTEIKFRTRAGIVRRCMKPVSSIVLSRRAVFLVTRLHQVQEMHTNVVDDPGVCLSVCLSCGLSPCCAVLT